MQIKFINNIKTISKKNKELDKDLNTEMDKIYEDCMADENPSIKVYTKKIKKAIKESNSKPIFTKDELNHKQHIGTAIGVVGTLATLVLANIVVAAQED